MSCLNRFCKTLFRGRGLVSSPGSAKLPFGFMPGFDSVLHKFVGINPLYVMAPRTNTSVFNNNGKVQPITRTPSRTKMDKKTDYNYTIETMSTTDTDDVMKLLRRTFYLDEPMNKAVNLFEEGIDSCPELDEYCTGCIKEGLSLKAIDKDGKIVSVLISGELPLINRDDMLIQAQQCKNPKFQKILYVLAAREAGAKLWEKYPQEKTLAEGKVAATEPSWRRKGIMNKLLARTESIVKQRGLRLLRVDTSSEYSAKSAERNGFTCVYQSLYSDIKLNGKTILLPEPPHLYDRVYIKDLKPESVSPGSELDQASRNKS